MTWHPEIYQDWLQDQYTKVAEYYEKRLEQESENPNDCWHLGLAYLLLGQEEQAQLTWLLVLSQYEGEALDSQIQSLTEILETEAERFEQEKKYQAAWLIRGHLREIAPDNYNNLLQFVCLDIVTSDSAIAKIQESDLYQLILSIPIEKVMEKVIERVLCCVSQIPSVNSIAIIRYYLKIDQNPSSLILVIVGSIQDFITRRQYPKYVIEVLNICLEYEPNNLSFLNSIFVIYNYFNEFDSAIETAEMCLTRSRSFTDKLFSSYQLVNIMIKISDWQRGIQISKIYMEYLTNFFGQEIETKYLFATTSFLIVSQPLYCLRDNPSSNRLLGNYVSQSFQKTFCSHTHLSVLPVHNNLTSDRPLKVGFIGHTLRSHPVGFLSRWLIYHVDRDRIKNYAYMFSEEIDDFAQKWFCENMESCTISAGDVQRIINQIQSDEIDILIDLDSWTYDLTCQVLALKPAPIQVTWLGFDASGIPNVDYFIADPYVLPDNAQEYYSENIWRLPNCYLGIDGFEIGIPTLKREDLDIPEEAVIFANFQNAMKRHPHILHQQMKILKAVPNSYFLVKGTGIADNIQNLFESIAQDEGVALEKLRFLEPCATEMEHRANLRLVDVMLDTYPYNGATTTLETLWMEIPLVTRVGEQFAARNSYTFMTNAGITEGIAWSDEEYVEWGIRLGTDENLRKEISYKLRKSKKTSPLWNGKQFAREMENAYRQMWEIYCQS